MRRFLFKYFKKAFDWFNAQWIDDKVHATTTVLNTRLGKSVRIGKHAFIGNSTIGDYCIFSGFNIVANTTVGKFGSIGSFVSICTGNHPTDTFASTSQYFYSRNIANTLSDKEYFDEAGSVEIGHDVWIGSNTLVVDNVKIGTGAIVAAGAVVTKDVPPYAIYGGVPARLIKMRFDEATIEALLKSKWWEKDDEWFSKNYKLMHNVNDLLAYFKEHA